MFAVNSTTARVSLHLLRQLPIHTHFTGYLCVKRVAAAGLEPRSADFKAFSETFLRVPGAPSRRPYVQIFVESDPSPHNRWSNPNVAGSYAQSSLRQGTAPFLQVVRVSGRRAQTRYRLVDRHWERARETLTMGGRIPVTPLAAFLFRNLGFTTDSPSPSLLIDAFRTEFGYPLGRGDAEFNHLYTDEVSLNPTELFIPL